MPPDAGVSANGTPLFRELRGEYVDDAGQVVTLREYLDFFEPLGTALSRLPDGAGGPFLHQFSAGGGRVIGAMGWVVNASARRYGAWKLWGLWADQPIPPLTLPLFWPELSDSTRLPDLIERANRNAGRLTRRDVFDDIKTTRLHDDRFRTLLKTHLTRAYRTRDARDRPIEVEISEGTLDLLPWLHLLGPVDPEIAQLQPNRFNGAGYQYILTNAASEPGGDIAPEIDAMVDTAAGDVLEGWRTAVALRERRSRPRAVVEPPVRHRPSPEISEMRKTPVPSTKPAAPPLDLIWRVARDVVIIALLAWIGLNLHAIRKRMNAPAPVPTSAAVETATAPAADSRPEPPPPTRAQRIADALSASPPRGMQVAPAVLESIRGDGAESTAALERVAIEIFLRRNACFSRAEIVDGKFSTAEQRAIRNCQILTRERLMTSDTRPHPERAVAWLERLMVTN
jgi:hypothetical protein